MRFKSLSSLVVLLLLSVLLRAQSSGGGKISVITNNLSYDTMSKSVLKDIFLGQNQVDDNNRTITIVLPSKYYPNAEDLIQEITGWSPNTFRRFWLSQVFQGRTNPPIYLSDNQKIIDFVKQNPGSIAFLYNYDGPEDITTIPIL